MSPYQMKRKDGGFSLLEVLIAVLVFSVGLLGMAGLMLVSVKTNHSAYLRTQASFLASSLIQRITSNRGELDTYRRTYNAGSAGADPCALGAACSPANQAARDIAMWSQQLVDQLPNPLAVMDCDGVMLGTASHGGAAPFDGLCTLTIEWAESTLDKTDGAAPLLQRFAWVFEP